MPTKSDVIHETGEFYGTMPDDADLPPTLPAGTRMCGFNWEDRFTTEARLIRTPNRREPHYLGQVATDVNFTCALQHVDWTTVRKSAPSPLPEFRAKVGDMVSGDNHPSYGIHPGTHRGKLVHIREEQGWANLELDDGQSRTVALDSVRPAPHPVESIPQAPSLCGNVHKFTSGKCLREHGHDGNHSSKTYQWSEPPAAYGAPQWRCRECGEHRDVCGSIAEDESGFVCGACATKCPSGGASGQSKADPRDALPPRRERTGVLLDPYRNGMTPDYVGRVAPPEDEKLRAERLAALSASTDQLDRLAAKRAAVLADIDRPSVTHDKMGRPIARWTGWTSTRWAK